ncbi:ERCC4 domain-containing protein [Peribacillus loiseleuriae]|uniref:ERCC4 domain-containing protein n=1 Tax=Peribacillus loiseleuriae TaxID=1679170 RepID=UPI00382E0AB8
MNIVQAHYKYSDAEIKKLLSTLVMLIDSREQVNSHITDFFDSKKVPYLVMKLDVGDYSVMLPKNEEMGIQRDLYLPVAIERKNSIDELIGNFLADKRTAFQNELIRSQEMDFVLMIEQKNGYEDMLARNYRSQMKPQSVIGTLKSFESRYKFSTIFVDKKLAPIWIYQHLFYMTRDKLKQM